MNRRIAMTIALGKFTKDEKDLFDIMDDWLRRDRFVFLGWVGLVYCSFLVPISLWGLVHRSIWLVLCA
ncbi:unnamed protein product [Brassica napus]|nr:unnamed protein product [Brassica napus]